MSQSHISYFLYSEHTHSQMLVLASDPGLSKHIKDVTKHCFYEPGCKHQANYVLVSGCWTPQRSKGQKEFI